jgi:sugar phosphate permease
MTGKNGFITKYSKWIIFGILGSIYFFAYFHRMALAVISKDLMSEFNLSASAIGILSSTYFYSYAALQIPVGVFCDTVGPKKTIAVFTLIASLGTVLFGLSYTFLMSMSAWLLVGAGVSATWVSTLKILSCWFKKDEFATFTGVLLAIGNFGAVMASFPLAVMVTMLGWRTLYTFLGILTFFLAILCLVIVKDSPQTSIMKLESAKVERKERHITNVMNGTRLILMNKNFWLMSIWIYIIYGGTVAFQGLWGGLYLMDTYQLSKSEAGTILMMIGLGMIIGSPVIGILSDKILKTRKWILVGWSIGFSMPWIIFMLYSGKLTIVILYILCFIIGFFGCSTVMIYTIIKELFPSEITGIASSIVNIFPFIGTATFQVTIGYLMDLIGQVNNVYPIKAYTLLFTFLTLFVSIAVVTSLFITDTYRLKCNSHH